MNEENDYSKLQDPDTIYNELQDQETLYADASGTSKKSPAAPPTKGASAAATAAAIKNVTVNAASKIKASKLVDINNKTSGLPAELNGKFKYDKKSNSISLQSLSAVPTIPAGKEWIYDLEKIANDWEVAAVTLVAFLDGPTYYLFENTIMANGEERGYARSKNPNDSLLEPTRDMINISTGLILGKTYPNESMLSKYPTTNNSLPEQVVRLNSKRGLILLANNIVVMKGGSFVAKDSKNLKTPKSIPVPNELIAVNFLHELSAHAGYFTLGLPAGHGDPKDPTTNTADRNEHQITINYNSVIAKTFPALEKNFQKLITETNTAIP